MRLLTTKTTKKRLNSWSLRQPIENDSLDLISFDGLGTLNTVKV